MADYQVNLELAIKNAKELQRTRVETKLLQRQIKQFNLEAKKGTTAVVKNFNSLSENVGRARSALNEAAIGTDKFNDAVRQVVKVEEEYSKELKARDRALKIERIAQQQGISLKKAGIVLTQQETEAERKLAAAKLKSANAESKKRAMSTISSAAIGGAFPLLFGQTGAAAVGGGIGGAAGGLIGGQFGFALSIVGTAIGSAIDQTDKFNASLASLDFAFRQAGDSSGFTKDRLKELQTTLGLARDEAMSVATAFSRFGEAGSNAAFIFGKNPNVMKNLAAIVNTKSAMTAILDTSNGLTIQQQIQLLQQGKISSFAEFQFKVNKAIIQQNFARQIQEAEQIKNAERVRFVFSQIARLAFLISTFGFSDIQKMFPDLFLSGAERAEERVNKLREALKQFEIDLPVLQDLMKDFSVEMEGMTYSIPMALDSVQAELRKLMSVGYAVTTTADTIGSAFGESFKGIVKGTMTAQDALRNLFERTADHFLDMAAQMIAKQIQMKILGIGLNFLGGGMNFMGGEGYYDSKTGLGTAGPNYKLADGGTAKAGKSYLVGERGPEMFTPGVTGRVTPNEMLGGGSTNIVVNVDASGSNVEGDDEQARQLGNLISASVQSELIRQKRPGGLLA